MTRTAYLLRDVMRLLDQLQHEEVACCGSTVAECTILTELHRTGEVSVSELGRRIGVDKGWVSRAVDGLAGEGIVEKSPSPLDRRLVLVSLSASGQDKCCELEDTLEGLSERVIGRLAADERAQVLRSLELLYGALQAEMQAAASSSSKP